MKKKFTAITLALVMLLTLVVTAACNGVALVYLEYNDGVTPPEVRIYDGNFTLPTPEREGYNFDGWYTDRELTQQFVNGTAMSSNFHLYAKWTPKKQGDDPTTKATITLVYQDGVTANKSLTVDKGSVAPLPTPSIRENYRFDGWFTSTGTQWTTQTVDDDITLYAHWTYIGNLSGAHTTHEYGDNYFMYVKCYYDGCNVYGRNEGSRNYDNKYTFTNTDKNRIQQHYNECLSVLNASAKTDVASFMTMHTQLEQDLSFVDGQYYWASIYYEAGKLSSIKTISTFYNTLFADFCEMYNKNRH